MRLPIKLIALLVICGTSLVGPQQSKSPSCSAGRVSIVGLTGIPIRFDKARYTVSSEGPAYADIKITNTSSQPLSRISFVLDYLDDGGKVINTVGFSSRRAPRGSTESAFVHAEHIDEELSKILYPAETKIVQGLSTAFSLICPTTARLIFLQLDFENGVARTWTAPDWNVGPILNYFPEQLHLHVHKAGEVETVSMVASINAEGHVIDLDHLENVSFDPTELLSELKTWSFFPAVKDGRPIDSSRTLVIQFLPDFAGYAPPQIPNDVERIFIKAVPVEQGTDRWRLFCEWRNGSTFLTEP